MIDNVIIGGLLSFIIVEMSRKLDKYIKIPKFILVWIICLVCGVIYVVINEIDNQIIGRIIEYGFDVWGVSQGLYVGLIKTGLLNKNGEIENISLEDVEKQLLLINQKLSEIDEK